MVTCSKSLTVTVDGERLRLAFCDIVKFESFGHDIYIHTEGGVYIVHTPLIELEKSLSDEFIRISQSVIVKKSAIRKRGAYLAGRCFITLYDGSQATVTRTHYQKFKEEMKKWL